MGNGGWIMISVFFLIRGVFGAFHIDLRVLISNKSTNSQRYSFSRSVWQILRSHSDIVPENNLMLHGLTRESIMIIWNTPMQSSEKTFECPEDLLRIEIFSADVCRADIYILFSYQA